MKSIGIVTGSTNNGGGIARLVWAICVLSVLMSPILSAQLTPERIDASTPANNEGQTRRDPFMIIDNIWWVGNSEISSFLITTSDGLIVMDPSSVKTVDWVIENIKKAGFKLEDIKFIINSHAHAEHMGGLAMLKKLAPDAKVVTSKGSADIMATGGKSDFRNIIKGESNSDYYEPVKVDRIIGHLEELKLGDVTMVANITSGHALGATTWTLKVEEGGRQYNAVIMGGVSTAGVEEGPLLNNEVYPEIAQDFEKSFAHLKSLQCDVYLARASSIDLDQKLAMRKQDSNAVNPFIDPAGCQKYINFYEARYKKQLAEEMAANKLSPD